MLRLWCSRVQFCGRLGWSSARMTSRTLASSLRPGYSPNRPPGSGAELDRGAEGEGACERPGEVASRRRQDGGGDHRRSRFEAQRRFSVRPKRPTVRQPATLSADAHKRIRRPSHRADWAGRQATASPSAQPRAAGPRRTSERCIRRASVRSRSSRPSADGARSG